MGRIQDPDCAPTTRKKDVDVSFELADGRHVADIYTLEAAATTDSRELLPVKLTAIVLDSQQIKVEGISVVARWLND